MTLRQEKINSLLRELAGSFIKENIVSSGVMMTATRAETTPDLRLAKIFISVYPEEKEKEIFIALKKREREFRNFVKDNIKMKFLPKVFFEIDSELKMERKIEELLKH